MFLYLNLTETCQNSRKYINSCISKIDAAWMVTADLILNTTVFGMVDFRGYDLAIILKRWGYDYWRRNGGVKGEDRIEGAAWLSFQNMSDYRCQTGEIRERTD